MEFIVVFTWKGCCVIFFREGKFQKDRYWKLQSSIVFIRKIIVD